MDDAKDMQTTQHSMRPTVIDSFVKRFLGLMGQKEFSTPDGLLLTRTGSVHTFFMRMPIDLVFLDGGGKVLAIVDRIRPWRTSLGPRASKHTLELPEGHANARGIKIGDRITFPPASKSAERIDNHQRGASLVEFTIVAPMITLLGMGIIQYGMLFFAKNNINHAAFMAARAGANEHADIAKVSDAYISALVPMYVSGQSETDLVEARAKAEADLDGKFRIELLNPTKESFDDWNDPALQKRLGTGERRVIPNSGQAFKTDQVKSTSGQSIQDANLIKLRITHGFQPKVPFISHIYIWALEKLDPKVDSFHTSLVQAGRIPVVTHVMLHMNSDAIESDSTVSIPGKGNGGNPTDPGNPPTSTESLPGCSTAGCTTIGSSKPPACDPATDANGCKPTLTCSRLNPNCDPECGVTMCCPGGSTRPQASIIQPNLR